jgi:hypothetical protein
LTQTALNIEIPVAANENSACLNAGPESPIFQFERPDWTLFRSVSTLPQKAGVPLRLLQRLVLKELVDNALDAVDAAGNGSVSIRREGNTYVVEDDGPGIPGTPEDIARMFSINRPMVSTKLLRLPKRGALGNGLRVVAGSVLASGGTLSIKTRNMDLALTPRDDGGTSVVFTPIDRPIGTAISISFGPRLPIDQLAMSWGQDAIRMAVGNHYQKGSSPFWYDGDFFFELLQAGGDRPVRELIAALDGCSGAKAGLIAQSFKGMPCRSLDRDQAVALLGAARSHARPVSASRLGCIGKHAHLPEWYASESGSVNIGGRNPKAEIPFVIEAWCDVTESGGDEIRVSLLVNRTPVAGEIYARKDKRRISIHGMGLGHYFEAERGSYDITVNIISPHVPITTDGKEPDLVPFLKEIVSTIQAAAKRAKRALPRAPERRSQKDIILSVLDEAIAKVSDSGKYRFNCRQLFYAVRPHIISELGAEPTYGNFTAIITAYEDEHGLIRDMYRDARGTLYHPHTGEDIPIGTLTVEEYRRPKWTFNKVLFIEKEGFFEALKAAQWPERYDCALLTSKGFSTRAVRDFLDMLAEDADEDITVFCAHDADAFGTMIFQTLQEETKARGRRKVEIINIGLEPWEAYQMGLEPEDRGKDAKDAPVADYIKNRIDGTDWASWLQRKRFELNAMTMPQFIQWLDGKMEEYGVRKVIPPVEVVRDKIREVAEFNLRTFMQIDILAAADFESRVASAVDLLILPEDEDIETNLPFYLDEHPADHWSDWTEEVAKTIAA